MIVAASRLARPIVSVAVAALLAACSSLAGPSPTTGVPAPSTAASSAPPSQPAATGSAVEPTPRQPPDALLTIDSRPAVAGSVGTYVFAGAGSDAPWLPGAALPAANGGPAVVRLVPDVGAGTWRIRRTADGDTDGSTARVVASGTGQIAFRLDAGGGTVVLDVEYAGGLGDGTYFWRLVPG